MSLDALQEFLRILAYMINPAEAQKLLRAALIAFSIKESDDTGGRHRG